MFFGLGGDIKIFYAITSENQNILISFSCNNLFDKSKNIPKNTPVPISKFKKRPHAVNWKEILLKDRRIPAKTIGNDDFQIM